MATNKSDNGSDYQSTKSAYKQQANEKRERKEHDHQNKSVDRILRDHPNMSYAEAAYKSRKQS